MFNSHNNLHKAVCYSKWILISFKTCECTCRHNVIQCYTADTFLLHFQTVVTFRLDGRTSSNRIIIVTFPDTSRRLTLLTTDQFRRVQILVTFADTDDVTSRRMNQFKPVQPTCYIFRQMTLLTSCLNMFKLV